MRVCLAIIAAVFAVTISQVSAVLAPITQLIVLGDSLSDSGRLFQLTNRTIPPASLYTSPIHSFTSGNVWHHNVQALGVNVTSYAVGGATGEQVILKWPAVACVALKLESDRTA